MHRTESLTLKSCAKNARSYQEARYYGPRGSMWLSPDPMHAQRAWLTPYNFVQNNPIVRVDPTGMLDYKPGVDENGNAVYIAEEGDDITTFMQQYNVSPEEAQNIFKANNYTTGLDDGKSQIGEGSKISGSSVKAATGSEVLSLNLNSNMATDQRVIDQAVFAMDYSKAKGEWGFASGDYFSNAKYKNVINASGFIDVGGESVSLELQLPVYRPATFDGSSHSTFLGNSPYSIKQTSGNRFGKTDLLIFDLYHPDTKNRMGGYRILAPRSGSDKIYNRLKR